MAAVKGKVVEGGRIIMPAAFRKSMGLSKGDTVLPYAASKPSCAPSHQARASCLTS